MTTFCMSGSALDLRNVGVAVPYGPVTVPVQHARGNTAVATGAYWLAARRLRRDTAVMTLTAPMKRAAGELTRQIALLAIRCR